jgi:hypothetical protein
MLAVALAAVGRLALLRGEGVTPELRRAVDIERRLTRFLGLPAPSVVLGQALMFTDALDEARPVLEAALAQSRAARDEQAAAGLLLRLAHVEWRAGGWERSGRLAREGRELYEQIGTDQERASSLVAGALPCARPRSSPARCLTRGWAAWRTRGGTPCTAWPSPSGWATRWRRSASAACSGSSRSRWATLARRWTGSRPPPTSCCAWGSPSCRSIPSSTRPARLKSRRARSNTAAGPALTARPTNFPLSHEAPVRAGPPSPHLRSAAPHGAVGG